MTNITARVRTKVSALVIKMNTAPHSLVTKIGILIDLHADAHHHRIHVGLHLETDLPGSGLPILRNTDRRSCPGLGCKYVIDEHPS